MSRGKAGFDSETTIDGRSIGFFSRTFEMAFVFLIASIPESEGTALLISRLVDGNSFGSGTGREANMVGFRVLIGSGAAERGAGVKPLACNPGRC